MAELLLSYGADVNIRNKHGSSPLHWAIGHSDLPLTHLLLEHGANVNTLGVTPLHTAAICGQTSGAQILIARGADVNARDRKGYTPLHEAAHQEMAELLRRHGGQY